jgi:hypothetical protein
MKKIALVLGLALLTFSCKKDCNCVVVTEIGKSNVVKGELVTSWTVIDTVGMETNCDLDNQTIYSAPTLRQRTICD